MRSVNTPALETQRLRLRRFDSNDINALLAIFGDRKTNTYLPMFPLETLAQARVFFEQKYEKAYQSPVGYRYAVCLKSDNIPIGYVHVGMEDSHDLGYGLRCEYWHRGIMTEAAGAVLRQLQEDGFPYVTATHDINNPYSGAVMKKLGMRYRYSYEEQWQPKNIKVIFRMYQLNLDGREDWVYRKYWEKAKVRFVEYGIA